MLRSWNELNESCPIDITRIVGYAEKFQSVISVQLNKENLDVAKQKLFEARSYVDLSVTVLIQLLYDGEILRKKEDSGLFGWLKEDLGRFLGRIDDRESYLMVEQERYDESKSMVSVSRLSAYKNLLLLTMDSIIYESLLKATNEYNKLKENKEKGIIREKRTFLYILYQILQVTLSVIGSLTREKTNIIKRRDINKDFPQTWQGMISDKGQSFIKDGMKEEMGLENDDTKFEELWDDFDSN